MLWSTFIVVDKKRNFYPFVLESLLNAKKFYLKIEFYIKRHTDKEAPPCRVRNFVFIFSFFFSNLEAFFPCSKTKKYRPHNDTEKIIEIISGCTFFKS